MAENKEDVLHVEGGKPLNGTIKVRGAKNFVSKAMVAALLAPGTSVLKNVPEIRDVHVVSDLLRLHGVDVDVNGDKGIVTINASHVEMPSVADVDTLAGSSRIPILFSGPLLHRLGEAFIPALGGCNIGGRPIDFHLETLRKLGADVDKDHADGIHITAPNGLKGAKIHLPYPSVGATEQTLLAAVLAEGKTELSGAATEPEIMDLVAVLQKMGAIISVDVDRTFRIEGVKELKGYTHTSLTDRIEAASWASAALATHGDIFVKGATQPEMMTFLNVFRQNRRRIRHHRQGHPLLASGWRPEPGGHRNRRASRFHDPTGSSHWSWRSPRPRACRSCTKPCTRTASASPSRLYRWAQPCSCTANASVRCRAASSSATTSIRPLSSGPRR